MIFFTGEDWETAEADNYKKLLTDKIGQFLTRPLVAGSLTTFLEKDFKTGEIAASRIWFLLFDLHRVVLYDDDLSGKNARIRDISYFLGDITTEKHLKLLKACALKFPVVPADFERTLEILPFFLEQDRPGWTTAFNTLSGEVTSARASKHPLTRSENSKPDAEYLQSRPVGSGGRGFQFPKIEPDISAETNVIRFSDLRINALSIPVGRSMVAWREGKDKFICGGKHVVPNGAEIISWCESLERFQVMYRPSNADLTRASYTALGDRAVNPDNLFYTTRNWKFDPADSIYWTTAVELSSGRSKYVPAQEIWFDTGNLEGEKLWITNTTNGCAVGGNFEEAVLFAILEAVERDAFLTCWYLEKKCRRIEIENLKNEHLHFLLAKLRYLKPQYEINFLDLHNDLEIPCVLAAAIRKSGTGPKFFCAVASGLNYAGAAFSALKDIQNLLSFPPTAEETEKFQTLQKEPTKILEPEEHQGIYTLDKMFEKVAFFDSGIACSFDELESRELTDENEKIYDAKTLIERLNESCQKAGIALFYKDITHESLKEKNFRCVKVIGEGLFPMWYGYYNIRVNLTERLKKLSVKANGREISELSELNLEIHPFG
jgi:thiazole/oxazole-forming peptide maturase SagD family component